MSRCSMCGYPLDKRDEPLEICEDCYNEQLKIENAKSRVPEKRKRNRRHL